MPLILKEVLSKKKKTCRAFTSKKNTCRQTGLIAQYKIINYEVLTVFSTQSAHN